MDIDPKALPQAPILRGETWALRLQHPRSVKTRVDHSNYRLFRSGLLAADGARAIVSNPSTYK
jgi:hypothetical protein